jgi:hypothetical protein
MALLNTTMDGYYSGIFTGSEFRTLQTPKEATGQIRSRRKWQDERRRWRVELTFTSRAAADAFRLVYTTDYGPAGPASPHTWSPPEDAATYNVRFVSDVLEEEWTADEIGVYRYVVELIEDVT